MIAIQQTYAPKGVYLAAINSNNQYLSPPDTLAEMVTCSKEKRFNVPYLKDEDGSVAAKFGATHTPHFFILNRQRVIQYRVRLDDARDPAHATYSYLENPLSDLLGNREVRVPESTPFDAPSYVSFTRFRRPRSA